MNVYQLPVLIDNYIYVVHDPESHSTAVIDPTLADPVLSFLEKKGWSLTHILNTHHHADHVGGNAKLQDITNCEVMASTFDQHRIPRVTQTVSGGKSFSFGGHTVHVLDVKGHTLGHIAFWMPDAHALFCGDALFSLGCGRLFEGTAEDMWSSLQTLRGLPDATWVYCAHEYTLNNARFARHVDPGNAALKVRAEEVARLRQEGRPTVPFLLGEDKQANPFLRADGPVFAQNSSDTSVEVFARLRHLKDHFV